MVKYTDEGSHSERASKKAKRRKKEQKLNKNALTLPLVREIRRLRESKWHATNRNTAKKNRGRNARTHANTARMHRIHPPIFGHTYTCDRAHGRDISQRKY